MKIQSTQLAAIRDFLTAHQVGEEMDNNGMIRHLQKMERSLRQLHGIEATLREQLAEAVASQQVCCVGRMRTCGDDR